MSNAVLISLSGMAIPIVIVPIALFFKYYRHERELEHAERMKALELGRTLPGDESWWTPIRLCAAIGVGVPLVAFAFAFIGSRSGMSGPDSQDAWHAAAGVGVAGVVCGTFLTYRLILQRGQAQAAQTKPEFDPDAYDVVGRRSV